MTNQTTGRIPYASEKGGGFGMVHEWKPIKAEVFAEAIHRYAVLRADEHGNGGLSQKSVMLDNTCVATTHYLKRPDSVAISSPVLMSIRYQDGRFVFFASMKYGDMAGDGELIERPEPKGSVASNSVPTLSEAHIKFMAERFLSWRLPEDFNPDGGIEFDAYSAQKVNPRNHKHEPVGTNLFDYSQALNMVRYMVGIE